MKQCHAVIAGGPAASGLNREGRSRQSSATAQLPWQAGAAIRDVRISRRVRVPLVALVYRGAACPTPFRGRGRFLNLPARPGSSAGSWTEQRRPPIRPRA